MNRGGVESGVWSRLGHAARWNAPVWAAPVLVGLVLSPLLAGYEPVGGDPDRIFRPIKAELARALRVGTLPFWSDRMGLGMPLLAESHAAALYPPNLLLYRFFNVGTAYRFSMWAHNVAIAAATAAYARFLGITPWGAAVSGVAFALCGFQAIHSSHEWAYHALLYFVLAVLASEKYLAGGRLAWMAAVAVLSGAGWTVGHFQIQTWTHVIVAMVAVWRVVIDRRPFVRSAGLLAALMWGVLIAAAQLGPSWELARFVGQEQRDRVFYSFPPAHWVELALPQAFRAIGPEDAYWFAQKSTGYEACFYVGTIPLVLAFLGVCGGNRLVKVWILVVAVTLALATMPRWWPQGYEWFLLTPGVGLFRCPARWTVFASFGLALLAGAGFDHATPAWRFRLGMAAAVLFGLCAFGRRFSELSWEQLERDWLRAGLGTAALAWVGATLGVALWRRRPGVAPLLVALAAAELGYLYYHMTTQWGFAVDLERDSPVMGALARERPGALVAGRLDNLPILAGAGAATADPYVGFRLIPPNEVLSAVSRFPAPLAAAGGWYRPFGVTHQILQAASEPARAAQVALAESRGGLVVWSGRDATLARVAPLGGQGSGPNGVYWTLLRISEAARAARIATRWGVEPGGVSGALLAVEREPDTTFVSRLDQLPAFRAEPAGRARVVSWDGRTGVVEHDGACALVAPQSYYAGWQYRVDGGKWMPVTRVDDGFQAYWIDGAGTSTVETRYEVTGWRIVASASVIATLFAILALGWSWRVGRRGDQRPADANA